MIGSKSSNKNRKWQQTCRFRKIIETASCFKNQQALTSNQTGAPAADVQVTSGLNKPFRHSRRLNLIGIGPIPFGLGTEDYTPGLGWGGGAGWPLGRAWPTRQEPELLSNQGAAAGHVRARLCNDLKQTPTAEPRSPSQRQTWQKFEQTSPRENPRVSYPPSTPYPAAWRTPRSGNPPNISPFCGFPVDCGL